MIVEKLPYMYIYSIYCPGHDENKGNSEMCIGE